MRVLITGGSGFVCLNIAQKLLMEGNDVFIYDKASLPSPALREFSQLSGTCTIIEADILNFNCLEETLIKHQITHIIHGAAITPTLDQEKNNPKQIIQVNFGGTMNVLECLKKHPYISLIYISSMAAAGTGLTKSSVIREADLAFYPTSSYGIAKFASEQMIQEYSRFYSFKAASVRLGAVFGPWEYPNSTRTTMSPALRIMQAMRNHKEVTFNRFSSEEWIYSKDVANYIFYLLQTDVYHFPSYCLVSGFQWTTQSWCDLNLTDLPNHSYRLCESNEDAVVHIYRDTDNAKIIEPYIYSELSYRPIYDSAKAFQDYSSWLKEHPDFINQKEATNV